MNAELSEDLKCWAAIAAGVPYETQSTFDPVTRTVKIKYTTVVPVDVRLVDGRFLVFQQFN